MYMLYRCMVRDLSEHRVAACVAYIMWLHDPRESSSCQCIVLSLISTSGSIEATWLQFCAELEHPFNNADVIIRSRAIDPSQ
jgi:hypothetical protein